MLRALGVTRTSLDRQIVNGNVAPAMVDEDGRKWWDRDKTLADYSANVRRKVDTVGNATEPGSAEVRAALGIGSGPEPDDAGESRSRVERERLEGESYQDARTRLARADADKRELEVAQKRGELVDVEAVQRALESIALTLRDSLQAIGARVAGELSTTTDARRCREIVDDEVRRCVAAASAQMRVAVPGAAS